MKKLAFYSVLSVITLVFAGCEAEAELLNETGKADLTVLEEPAQTVGVNFNGQFDMVDLTDLERTNTTWVRGFTDFFQLYPQVEKLHTDQRLAKYLELKKNGYKTILNIKWDFSNKSFPDPESEEMDDYKKYLRKLLGKIWMSTDIIVIGNEPFIESRPAERDQRLVAFYIEIAKEVRDFKKGKGVGNGIGKGVKQVPIYLGAFNNLYLPGWRTPAVEELLTFTRQEPWIAGIDLHIHHSGTHQLYQTMDYVDNKIREGQKIIITEYSLMKHWKLKMGERIPAEFADRYGRNSQEQNYQYLDHALKTQVSHEEWSDFLASSYWFRNKSRYLWNSYELFKSYDKFHLATYAMRQSYPFNKDFTRNTDPWILNGLYANRTVETDPATGEYQFNHAWIADFLAIQEDRN